MVKKSEEQKQTEQGDRIKEAVAKLFKEVGSGVPSDKAIGALVDAILGVDAKE